MADTEEQGTKLNIRNS